jgi:hypothetical protein
VDSEQTTDAANPIARYLALLTEGNAQAILDLCAGEPHIDDPLGGHILGGSAVRDFLAERHAWLRERAARVEMVRVTQGLSSSPVVTNPYLCVPPIRVGSNQNVRRTVTETILHLTDAGRSIPLPVAVAGEVDDAGKVYGIRVYHSLWPLYGAHRVRPPILSSDPALEMAGVVERYQQALASGDLEGILATFEEDGYAREPSGGPYVYEGRALLRELYGGLFTTGGIPLEHCTLTDDGVCAAVEYNAVQLGQTKIAPQAGVAVYERGSSSLLRAARIYDDVAVEEAGEITG